MNAKVLLLLAAASAAVTIPVTSEAQCGHGRHGEHAAAATHDHGSAATAARSVEITVTENGFSPAQIRLERGATVTLVVTRTTDQTCARELIIPDYAVRKALPLGEAVAIELTPAKASTVRFACGMDMVSGVLVVE